MKNREIRHAESTEFSARTEIFVYGNKFDVVRLPGSLKESIFFARAKDSWTGGAFNFHADMKFPVARHISCRKEIV